MKETIMTNYECIFEQCQKFNEIFVDEDFVNHGIHGYENVISIKGRRNFWDADGKRISAIAFILNACCVVPQLIGFGDEVVFAVASDDYGLESDVEWNLEYMKSPLNRKIDEITRKEYYKNLVLGCMLIEKFIRIVDPKVNAEVKCYDRDYLLGHFVIECPCKLFMSVNSITSIKDMALKSKKMDAFIDLINNLVAPPWEDPF